jgi:hypothetical protein
MRSLITGIRRLINRYSWWIFAADPNCVGAQCILFPVGGTMKSLLVPAVLISNVLVLFAQSGMGVKVSGRVLGASNLPVDAFDRVEMSGPPNSPYLQAKMMPDGSFEFLNVLPGKHGINMRSALQGRVLGVMPTSVIVADKDLNGVELNIPAQTLVSGHIVVDNGGPVPTLDMELVPSHLQGGPRIPLSPTIKADGKFTVIVPEGLERTLRINGFPKNGYRLKAITYGNTDLLKAPLKILPGEIEELNFSFEGTQRQ